MVFLNSKGTTVFDFLKILKLLKGSFINICDLYLVPYMLSSTPQLCEIRKEKSRKPQIWDLASKILTQSESCSYSCCYSWGQKEKYNVIINGRWQSFGLS